MPADARREPPSEARHGHGRPPDGPPDEGSWAFARGFMGRAGVGVGVGVGVGRRGCCHLPPPGI